MKINKILYKIIILTFLVIMCTASISHAAKELNDDLGGGGATSSTESTETTGGGSTGLPNLEEYTPQVTMGSSSKSIISTILSVMTVLGVVTVVIGFALIGFNSIMGSASEKAAGQEKYVGLVIAAVVLIAGSSIAKMIISIAEGV